MEKGILTWDRPALVAALGIADLSLRLVFKDGRTLGALVEARVAAFIGGKLVPGPSGGGNQLLDKDGHPWEVRTFNSNGIRFAPSYMSGKGRKFDAPGFRAHLLRFAGCVVADIEHWPAHVRFWRPGSGLVGRCENDRKRRRIAEQHAQTFGILRLGPPSRVQAWRGMVWLGLAWSGAS